MNAPLRQTLNGTIYGAAGGECGVDYRDLHKNAKRLGLDRAHLEAWRDYWGPAIAPAWVFPDSIGSRLNVCPVPVIRRIR
jgi:hypothetical protein